MVSTTGRKISMGTKPTIDDNTNVSTNASTTTNTTNTNTTATNNNNIHHYNNCTRHSSATSQINNNNYKLSRQLHEPHVTLLEYKSMRFLITEQPSPCNLENFIMVCRLHKVGVLVRVCEPTYDKEMLENAGIKVVDLEFDDGAPPPDDILDRWFHLIVNLWRQNPQYCVAVHCVAGLGRAPALVAAALIELGMSFHEAVEMIRERRKGALNTRQIQFLKNFRPRKRLRVTRAHSDRCNLL